MLANAGSAFSHSVKRLTCQIGCPKIGFSVRILNGEITCMSERLGLN